MNASVSLLERAVSYALSAVDTVTPELLSRATPCSAWDLQTLIRHGCESVAALHEGLATGRVALYPTVEDDPTNDPAADPTHVLRARATSLIEVWPAGSATRATSAIRVADHLIPWSLMTGAAALEITVHGWDIAQASGDARRIPTDLAIDLLAMSQILVPLGNRHRLFAPPVHMALAAGPGEILLAYLGRCAI